MSNKNENNFCIVSGPGGVLKLNIIIHKVAIITYIWSSSANLENYRKLILWWKDCNLVVAMSNKNKKNFCVVSGPGDVKTWYYGLQGFYSNKFGVFLEICKITENWFNHGKIARW